MRVKRARTHTRTCGHPDNRISVLAPAVMNFGKIIYDLIKPHTYKIRKLHFHNAFKTLQG